MVAAMLAMTCVATACTPLVDVSQTATDLRSSVRAPTQPGGEAVIALDQEPDELDPTMATTLASRQVFASMCEKLFDVDSAGRVVPQLAGDEPRVSPDGHALTIPLRQDVLFNDGTPMDAAAVRQSIERHLHEPSSGRASELTAVESVEALDRYTVRLHLSRPSDSLPSVLADRAGMIMSPTALAEHGEDFGAEPVCAGPFRFVERVAQDRIVLQRSDFYYDRDRVRLERLTYRVVPDDNIRVANLRSGEYDVMWSVATPDVPIVAQEDGIELLNQPSIQYMGITVNTSNVDGEEGEVPGPLANDPRVRRALSLAIDRDTLNEIAFNGLYQPACGPIPPTSEYGTPATQQCPPHDPERARELLAEAGVDTPLRVEMTVQNTPESGRVGQVVQAMAEEVGFDVSLRPTESTALMSSGETGDFQSLLVGWSGRSDPDGNIANMHTSHGAQNYSGQSDPDVDQLIQRAAAEQDFAQRRALYERVVRALQERNNVIYLYREQWYTAHSDQLAGVEVNPDGIMRLKTAGHVANES